MYRFRTILAGMILCAAALGSFPLHANHSQIEFTAVIESIDLTGPGGAVLTLRLTPSVSTPVRVAASTEIKDQADLRISVQTLRPGDTVKVEAFFTDAGILAREVELTEPQRDFELKGAVQSVDASNRVLTLLDFPIQVPSGAEIQDAGGAPLALSEIQAGDFVKVEGLVTGTALVARQIKVGGEAPRFAQVRLEGTIVEIGAGSILIELPGGPRALVEIGDDTIIRGALAVGVRVEVRGRLTPSLTVAALEIEVQKSLQLLPDEIRLQFSQMRRVDVVLATAFSQDVTLTLETADASVAVPVEASVLIPAGVLTASFEVASMNREGRTVIRAALPVEVGGATAALEVEVEDDQNDDNDPDELVEIRWSPREIETGGVGAREVRLVLNRPAPETLEVTLSLKEGTPGTVTFPASVEIPAGERTAALEIVIVEVPIQARIRARLPASVGGDGDTLDIELGNPQQANLDLRWEPDDLEMNTDSQAVATLRLDAPAPFDFEAVISVKDGDPSLVSGVPSVIQFSEGQRQAQITVRSGAVEGEVRFRAALPIQLGGDTDDLKIEIEN